MLPSEHSGRLAHKGATPQAWSKVGRCVRQPLKMGTNTLGSVPKPKDPKRYSRKKGVLFCLPILRED